MKFEIIQPGAYAMLKVTMNQGESLKAESGAMAAMHPNLDVETNDGGIFGALKRILTEESLQTLKAARGPGDVYLAPAVPGDVAMLELNGSNYFFLQKQAFLAGDVGLTREAVSRGLFQGFLRNIQKVSGKGILVISSFGSIYQITLAPGQQYVIVSSHLVAWAGTVTYDVKKTRIGSGKRLVCKVKGPGDIWFQSHNAVSFKAKVRQLSPDYGDGDGDGGDGGGGD